MNKKISYELTYEDYKNEMDIISKRNSVEVGLYFTVEFIIRSVLSQNYTTINVSSRRKWLGEDYEFYNSETGFPDLLVINKNGSKPIASVEVKYPIKEGILDLHKLQLEGHQNKFKNCIHTDFFEWRFISEKTTEMNIIKLATYQNKKIIWNEDDQWDVLINQISFFFNQIKLD
ncbi:hypothetical protein [Vagococcus fluvialis]|uniref:hypothetical protein n=1 Tax=Vagococcus fluvialis TaxID=2738 RepID=UPI001432F795|nr:hypothetical protein [Vagococcus fluvialis]NKC58874.1 hypothetical protein [Vagococcus fluvialis]NKD49628.1 hypothetical protein [Vagococcus fluvialis]UDM79325.1 hypothetical protein K5K97_11545 [Vagococcus fluvialis]